MAAGCGGSSKKNASGGGTTATTTSGGGGTSNPIDVLKSIKTDTVTAGPANIELDLNVTVQGTPTDPQLAAFAGKPITFTLKGVTDSASNKLDATFTAGAGPIAITGGLRSDGTNSWLELNNKWYVLPPNALSSPGTAGGTSTSKIDTSAILKAFGDPTKLVTNAQDKGEEDIGGVKTEHVSGDIDIAALVTGFANATSSINTTSSPVQPAQITAAVSQVQKYIKSASIDVWVGQDDHVIHKASVALTGQTDSATQTQSGISGFNVTFGVTSTPTSSPTITAPPNPAPIAQLQQDLGGLLGGLAGAAGGGGVTPPITT